MAVFSAVSYRSSNLTQNSTSTYCNDLGKRRGVSRVSRTSRKLSVMVVCSLLQSLRSSIPPFAHYQSSPEVNSPEQRCDIQGKSVVLLLQVLHSEKDRKRPELPRVHNDAPDVSFGPRYASGKRSEQCGGRVVWVAGTMMDDDSRYAISGKSRDICTVQPPLGLPPLLVHSHLPGISLNAVLKQSSKTNIRAQRGGCTTSWSSITDFKLLLGPCESGWGGQARGEEGWGRGMREGTEGSFCNNLSPLHSHARRAIWTSSATKGRSRDRHGEQMKALLSNLLVWL